MQTLINFNKIQLETCSLCQLKCPCCHHGLEKELPAIGKGYLSFKNFKQLILKNSWIKHIEISAFGEIFLNPNLTDIFQHAYEKNIMLTADAGVNLNTLSDNMAEALVKYKVMGLNCSIDGATNETYTKYRIGGSYNNVINNIEKINFYKKLYNSSYPVLTWQFILFTHNKHELEIARKKAQELNMKFSIKLSTEKQLSLMSEEEFTRQYKVNYVTEFIGICYRLWQQPLINWNGNILGCCYNTRKEFTGNAFKDNLFDILNGQQLNYARKMLLGENEPREDIYCSNCTFYLKMKKEKKWLKKPNKYHLLQILRKKIKNAK